jgi:hypothetical protein
VRAALEGNTALALLLADAERHEVIRHSGP